MDFNVTQHTSRNTLQPYLHTLLVSALDAGFIFTTHHL